MRLKALLLDVDGTVADTETYGHRPAYNCAFRHLRLGFRWNPRLYRVLLAQPGGRERILHYVQHYHPDLGLQAQFAANDMHAWVDQVHQLKTRYFQNYVRKGKVPLRLGVTRLIREAKAAGLKVGLVSNASPASLAAILEFGLPKGVASQIDLIVNGCDVVNKKPSPDIYLHALNRLGLTARNCVAIEDSSIGLRAATAAGIRTVITRNANTVDDDFSSAALVLDGLGEPDAPAKVIRGKLRHQHLTLADAESLLESMAHAA